MEVRIFHRTLQVNLSVVLGLTLQTAVILGTMSVTMLRHYRALELRLVSIENLAKAQQTKIAQLQKDQDKANSAIFHISEQAARLEGAVLGNRSLFLPDKARKPASQPATETHIGT